MFYLPSQLLSQLDQTQPVQVSTLNTVPAGGGPHYEVPNLTSMLYEYTNKEQERLLMGFRRGNFVSLRDIPNDMTNGNVLNA